MVTGEVALSLAGEESFQPELRQPAGQPGWEGRGGQSLGRNTEDRGLQVRLWGADFRGLRCGRPLATPGTGESVVFRF